jgi:hypothetical protein
MRTVSFKFDEYYKKDMMSVGFIRQSEEAILLVLSGPSIVFQVNFIGVFNSNIFAARFDRL